MHKICNTPFDTFKYISVIQLSQQSLLNTQTAEGDFPIVFGNSPCFHSQYDHGHNQEILASIESYL